MSDHSTGSLRDKLRARTEESRAGVRELVDEQLQTLTAELSQSVAGAKRTIEADIQRLTRDARRWLLRPVAYGMLAAIGVAIGAAGLSAWLGAGIRTRIESRARLNVEILAARETLQQIEAVTWGVRFQEQDAGRFLVLPEGMEAETGWTVGDREALKLEAR